MPLTSALNVTRRNNQLQVLLLPAIDCRADKVKNMDDTGNTYSPAYCVGVTHQALQILSLKLPYRRIRLALARAPQRANLELPRTLALQGRTSVLHAPNAQRSLLSALQQNPSSFSIHLAASRALGPA